VLSIAAGAGGFEWFGDIDAGLDDFVVTSIGGENETETTGWNLFKNLQPVNGGCAARVSTGDSVLWAFDAANKAPLKLTGPVERVQAGALFNVTVTDALTGLPVAGASVDGVVSDANGVAKISLDGSSTVKAEKEGWIRSNGVAVTVYAIVPPEQTVPGQPIGTLTDDDAADAAVEEVSETTSEEEE